MAFGAEMQEGREVRVVHMRKDVQELAIDVLSDRREVLRELGACGSERGTGQGWSEIQIQERTITMVDLPRRVGNMVWSSMLS